MKLERLQLCKLRLERLHLWKLRLERLQLCKPRLERLHIWNPKLERLQLCKLRLQRLHLWKLKLERLQLGKLRIERLQLRKLRLGSCKAAPVQVEMHVHSPIKGACLRRETTLSLSPLFSRPRLALRRTHVLVEDRPFEQKGEGEGKRALPACTAPAPCKSRFGTKP